LFLFIFYYSARERDRHTERSKDDERKGVPQDELKYTRQEHKEASDEVENTPVEIAISGDV